MMQWSRRWPWVGAVLIGALPIAALLAWLLPGEAGDVRLRFLGDLPLFGGMWLALVLAGGALFLYRRESSAQAGRLGWAMAAARALVVLLIVLMLTGPELNLRRRIEQRGKVLVFLDGSASMGATDEQMPASSKVLIAQSCGLIDEASIDTYLLAAAERMGEIRHLLVDAEGMGGDQISEVAQRILAEADEAIKALEATQAFHQAVDGSMAPKPAGMITLERWHGIGGNAPGDLVRSGKLDRQPDHVSQIDRLETTADVADDYGQRIRGFLFPPESGTYRFFMVSDDGSELKLSADDDPAGARSILRLDSYTPDWRTSDKVELEAGKRYYIEVLHKEGNGGDYLRVGWRRPGGAEDRPIPGKYLAPYEDVEASPSEHKARLIRFVRTKIRDRAARLTGEIADEEAARRALVEIGEATVSPEKLCRLALDRQVQTAINSGDAVLANAMARIDQQTRWERMERTLTKTDGLLAKLEQFNEVEVHALEAGRSRPLWHSRDDEALAGGFRYVPEAPSTDLGMPVRQVVDASLAKPGDAGEREKTWVVLMSDGQHNGAASPTHVAELLGNRGVPMFTVGIGAENAAEDLAITGFERVPDGVDIENNISGNVLLYDSMPKGKPFKISIEHDGKVVWEEQLVTEATALVKEEDRKIRRVAFDFPVREIAEDLQGGLDDEVEATSLPLRFEVKIEPLDGEKEAKNNAAVLLSRAFVGKKRVLIMDGRPRWEFRYIRNMFERDIGRRRSESDDDGAMPSPGDRDREAWQVTAVLPQFGKKPEEALPRGEKDDQFPRDRESLFTYDLIVFGEVPRGIMRDEELEWIRDFVRHRGGGVILVDGRRGKLAAYLDTPLGDLLPIRYREDEHGKRGRTLGLTRHGRDMPMLWLARKAGEDDPAGPVTPEDNEKKWRELEPPRWVPPVEAQPGAQVLVESTVADEDQPRPLLVTRGYGAGKVYYSGTDETWRWRYEVADRYQTGLWRQVGDWVREKPFHVRDRHVAVGLTGGARYQAGEQVTIRARVFDDDGKPVFDADVEAHLMRNDEPAGVVKLLPRENAGGLYEGMTSSSLEPGEYEVRIAVDRLSRGQVKAKTVFQVAADNAEQGEMAVLHVDRDRLETMAAKSHGRYFREEELLRLADRLDRPANAERVSQNLALWRSYWWFVPIIMLLTCEWIMRKRVGML